MPVLHFRTLHILARAGIEYIYLCIEVLMKICLDYIVIHILKHKTLNS